MSALVVVDPNVLIGVTLNHRDCAWAVLSLTEHASEICLALDPDDQIFRAYSACESRLLTNNTTKAFIKQFLNQRAKRQRVPGAVLDERERRLLADDFDVRHPVEPELIAVGKSAPGQPKVVVVGEPLAGIEIPSRATNTSYVIDQLHKEFTSLCVCPVRDIRQQLDSLKRSRYPGTEEELQSFIIGGESEFIEFKQPHEKDNFGKLVPTTRLTRKHDYQSGIVAQALEAVCAMVNCEGGIVFVGITPEGEILGIEPPDTTASGKPDDDALCRRFTDEFRRLDPPVNQFVKPSVIPLSNGRRVIALHITAPKNGNRYSFYARREWAIFDRCGPSNRKTQVIPGNRRRG